MPNTYQGSDFTGELMSNPNIQNVGPTQMPSPEMFGTDSLNPLGAETKESLAHEMAEPKGPNGEDID